MALSTRRTMSYLVEVDTHLKDRRGLECFSQIMLDFEAQKIDTNNLINKVSELFDGNEILISGFNNFIPRKYEIDVPAKYDDVALTFVKKVNSVFKDDQKAFSDFLQILDLYRRKKKSIIEVYQDIGILFRGHHDLFIELRTFLPDTNVKKSISPPLDIIHDKKKHKSQENSKKKSQENSKKKIQEKFVEKRICSKELGFFDKVKTALSDSDTWQEVMKCVELYNKELITKQELSELANELLGEYPELVKNLDEFLKHSGKRRKSGDICSSNTGQSEEKLKLLTYEQISPSYRVLPRNSTDTTAMHEFLNDQYRCVTDTAYRDKLINKYERKLFDTEDKMFNMDMKIRQTKATAKSVGKLLRKMRRGNVLEENSVLCLKKHFTEKNLRCIKELTLGHRASDPLESLTADTRNVLPNILDALKVEIRNLSQQWANSKKGWATVFAANHRKALGFP